MIMNSVQISITRQIEEILLFLEPLLPLANSHMVDFFTNSHYNLLVNSEIRREIDELTFQKTLELIFEHKLSPTHHLQKYVDSCRNLTLKNSSEFCLNIGECHDKLKLGCLNIHDLKFDAFMKQKKSHEVEMLSAIAVGIKQITNSTHVVDIGDGKGYLSSTLALQHKIPVLGIDASSINTDGAVKRMQKMGKRWRGTNLPNNYEPGGNNHQLDLHSDMLLYKQVTVYVHENIDFNELISNVYMGEVERTTLVGLHTCGNLAPTSIRIFNNNDSIRSICNVGCCYHLLKEMHEIDINAESYGFPMSKFLIDKQCTLGRNARMVASQSIDRILDQKELLNMTVFYRALLQILLKKHCDPLPSKHVGKQKKYNGDFSKYARMSLKKLDLDINVSDVELQALHKDYFHRIHELNVFHLLRSMLSPLIESLILLDRLLFLHEQGHTNSFLVQLFEPVVSPRCYGLISIKQSL